MKESLDLSHLPPASRDKITKLFCEYKEIFTKTDESVGKFPDIYHHIPTEEGKIVRRKPYRIPYAERLAYQAEIDRLKRLGIIVRSTSEWCNPTIFLHKVLPCGRVKSKIILDSRSINQITTDSVPFKTKRLDEALDFLSNKTHISKFDLASAFMSVPINPDHTHKLAFEGLRGEKWEYVRGCYGLKYLPMTFSWAMDTATSTIPDCYPYFDDVCLASHSFEQHLNSMRLLFSKLKSHNLKLRLDKTEVLPPTLSYLGFEITNGTIRPQKAKLEAIKKCPPPSGPPHLAKKALKSFLALTNWIRKFIPNYATLTKPLYYLTRPSAEWKWTEEHNQLFEKLKDELTSDKVVLHLPDLSKPMTIIVDSSNYGQGALLSQTVNGRERVIAYASRNMKPCELKRSVIEKELSGVCWALKLWRMYTAGTKTYIKTDHKPLLTLRDSEDNSALLSRP
ncbi:hypothetical protein FOCC_FOCC011076 [Frankliniella occidentalis]|nr:hypothetical protein FOCC_FOCC011076 [Frankliniella occidentalis]